MFTKILKRLGVIADHGAPVHAGANPVYFTSVYGDDFTGGWVFSWRTADHVSGGQWQFSTRSDARYARASWATRQQARDNCTFVHEG